MCFLRPPPGRRTRSAGAAPSRFTSFAPVITVVRDILAAFAAALVPPWTSMRAVAPTPPPPSSSRNTERSLDW